MLPLSNSSSQVKDRGVHGNPKRTITAFDFKKALNFVRSHVSFHQFAWALILFLLEFCIFLAFTATTRAPSPPTAADRLSPVRRPQLQGTPPEQVSQQPLVPPHHPDDRAQCKYGRVYVYDLPPIFNKKLLENCQDLDPRRSQCAAVSNDGFGPNATTLAGTVPRELAHAWYWTDLFAGEIIFHARISTHRCRTMEPESAAAFYVPFYAGLAVSKYLFTNYTAKERDAPCQNLLRWIKGQPHWKRSNGSDHFLMLGRSSWDFRRARDGDWGTSFLLMPLMRQMFRLTIEKSLGDPLEVSVPYPSGFHPRTTSEVGQWQEFVRSRKRSSLFTFVGGKRGYIKNDFRALLLDQCYEESDSCKAVDCAKTPCLDGASSVLDAFLDSDFCLQPRGDSVTRRSTFDCMLAGSIPVFFWEGTVGGQYELYMSDQTESFSVFIHRNKVRNGTSIRKVLEGYSREDVKRMREKVIDMIPRISYAFPAAEGGLGNLKDAFDIGVEEVLRRIVKNANPYRSGVGTRIMNEITFPE
ncbi:unnamed protein product [Coffea canephora]|uniref:Exostosin GT47 domain-containing protein n=1 Tax=Coffea canephora TaxID=49390 RepID=A0A068U1Y3_COFCA|nr:unnamed protein product [Coffea canephora]